MGEVRTHLKQALEAGIALYKIRVLKRRVPLFVAWNLTFRCNLNCKYCGCNDVRIPECSTPDVTQGLDHLWQRGARWITFGGGEPLVREDIGEILKHAKSRGFRVYLSTNGWLAERKKSQIRCVDHVNLSLDGAREVHDFVRGEGAFDKAMESIQVFKELGISVSLLCVLSKCNLDQAQHVVELASEHGLYAMFQPADRFLNTSKAPNPISPPVDDYRETIRTLIDLKKRGGPIRNSVTGLKHLAQWPDSRQIWCPAGRLITVVEPDGKVLACHVCAHTSIEDFSNNGAPLLEQLDNLQAPANCAQCWCAPLVELGLLFSLKPEPAINAFRVLW